MDDLHYEKQRVATTFRLPRTLLMDVKTLAAERGMTTNSMVSALLRYGVSATKEKVTLGDRLSLMGVK